MSMFHFLKRWIRDNLNGKCQLSKLARSRYIVILIKPLKGLELVFSLQHLPEMFVIQHTKGQLKTLGTKMGYPIGVPIWVLRRNKSIKIIDNVVMVINN